MHSIKTLLQNAESIEAKLGYFFKNRDLLALAFIHRSYVNEHREVSEHNERLEFLGDSVLGLIIAEYLFLTLPETPEGQLSYLRSRLVEASTCVTYVQKLDIESFLLLGKGEKLNYGRGRTTILADLFEAIIGAIYLDGGIEPAKLFLFNNFSSEIKEILDHPLLNWKALLQDWCQKNYGYPPDYQVVDETGPDHSKQFQVNVSINQRQLGKGKGASKKEAQQAAAEDALSRLDWQT
jgi:ribonuclease III